MSLMKFPRQCIRLYPEKFANTVANTGESGAKYLLLTFSHREVVFLLAVKVVAKLWNAEGKFLLGVWEK